MRAVIDWESGVSSAWRNVTEFVPKLVLFLIILLIGWIVARVLQRVTLLRPRSTRPPPGTATRAAGTPDPA